MSSMLRRTDHGLVLVELNSETEPGKDNAQRKDKDKEPLSLELSHHPNPLSTCMYGTVGTGTYTTVGTSPLLRPHPTHSLPPSRWPSKALLLVAVAGPRLKASASSPPLDLVPSFF
jgi:hypothetical protein